MESVCLEVRFKLLGDRIETSEQALNLNTIRWLERMLPIAGERIPRYARFLKTGYCWMVSPWVAHGLAKS